MCCAANCIPLMIQQNINGSDFFNRSWAEFKVGFNDSSGNFWLGNELIHQLTHNHHPGYTLRFDLQQRDSLRWYYVEYSSFVVFSETTNYRMLVTGHSGNTNDAFSYSSGMMFTTYDRDNDPWTNTDYNNNCAVYEGGGFWYNQCAYANVNTVRGHGDDFNWHSSTGLLQSSRMWLMC